MDKYIALLPDDIVDKIYSKIYYPQKKDLLYEIKLVYYIKKNLVKRYGLFNVCCCAIIHNDYYNNIDSISLQCIDDVHNKISILTNQEAKKLLKNIVCKMSLEKKYSFIFYLTDRTIRDPLYDINNYIKYVIDNTILNNLNR